MSSTQFWVGALAEFDDQTKIRVTSKQYPLYYSFLYTLWVLILLGTGIAELLFMMIYGQSLFPKKSFAILTLVGLINMIGIWAIAGAILDALFWLISPASFRDYVIFRQLQLGWGYDIKQQILTLLKIGFIYYIFALPLTIFLLV